MSQTLNYRGYSTRIEFSAEDQCLVGRIVGIDDVVGFHGESVAEVTEAFHEAVDDYLETCARLGKSPEKPYSGRILLRLPPDLHASVAHAAQLSGRSINQWVMERLQQGLN